MDPRLAKIIQEEMARLGVKPGQQPSAFVMKSLQSRVRTRALQEGLDDPSPAAIQQGMGQRTSMVGPDSRPEPPRPGQPPVVTASQNPDESTSPRPGQPPVMTAAAGSLLQRLRQRGAGSLPGPGPDMPDPGGPSTPPPPPRFPGDQGPGADRRLEDVTRDDVSGAAIGNKIIQVPPAATPRIKEVEPPKGGDMRIERVPGEKDAIVPVADVSMTQEQIDKIRDMMGQHLNAYHQTDLSSAEERKFLQEMKASYWYQDFTRTFGQAPDLDDPTYDYRGAWKRGLAPKPEPGAHWPDRAPDGHWLKSPEHPAAWKEYYQATTGRDPDDDQLTQEDFDRQIGGRDSLYQNPDLIHQAEETGARPDPTRAQVARLPEPPLGKGMLSIDQFLKRQMNEFKQLAARPAPMPPELESGYEPQGPLAAAMSGGPGPGGLIG